jgi:uncharacterized protein involved in response to NO
MERSVHASARRATGIALTVPVLFGRGFRPFFLLTGIQALFAIGAWLAMLRGVGPLPSWSSATQWHAHEMLFGFAGAALAGFLLTSAPAWTGRPAVTGARLAALAGLWLAGRIAVFFAGALPSPWIAAAIDASFFAALATATALPIFAARSRRNYAFPLLLAVLAVANLLTHLGAMGSWPGIGAAGMRLATGSIVLIVATIGGRLVPLFTRAAIKRVGAQQEVRYLPWADAGTGPLVGIFVIADTIAPGTTVSGALAIVAGIVVVLRTKGWALGFALRDPLLWSMHIAYLWIPIGLVALGISTFSAAVPRNLALHALTSGAIGGMILAIMTRVALGHTGRAFRAPPGIPLAYGLLLGAAIARTFAPLFFSGAIASLLLISGLLWIGAFALFLAVYTPYLIAPRVDGKPG